MKEKTESAVLFMVVPLICVVCFAAVMILAYIYEISYRVYDFFPMLMIVLLLFVLSRTFVSHEKNAMKAALSAILAVLLSWELYYLTDQFTSLVITGNSVGDFYDWFLLGARFASCVLMTVIMTFHFLLTAEHKSNPKRIRTNTIAFMLVAVVFLTTLTYDAFNLTEAVPGRKWWGVECSAVCMKVFEIAALLEVIRIEILLDMFRSRREQKKPADGFSR